MTLTRAERSAFVAEATKSRPGPEVMTGSDAVNYMIQAAGGA